MSSHYALYDPRCWWDDLAGVWQDTRLIVVTAQIAAIYAAILIPFKAGIPIIPGFVELRPAKCYSNCCLLVVLGPAAAWGAGIGNIIGDCFGTLGPASVFGFLGNFLLGYLPYLMWGNLGVLSSGQPPIVKSWAQGFEYGLICVVASGACAGVIGWGVELLGLLPFIMLAPAVFFNKYCNGVGVGAAPARVSLPSSRAVAIALCRCPSVVFSHEENGSFCSHIFSKKRFPPPLRCPCFLLTFSLSRCFFFICNTNDTRTSRYFVFNDARRICHAIGSKWVRQVFPVLCLQWSDPVYDSRSIFRRDPGKRRGYEGLACLEAGRSRGTSFFRILKPN